MKTFKELYEEHYWVLDEALHSDIEHAIKSPQVPAHERQTHVAIAIRRAIANHQDTGLDDVHPKKGSSRAVYFPREEHHFTLDGKPAKTKTVMKVAYPGHLDAHNYSGKLLGEHQNKTEADPPTNQHHGIISKDEHGNFHTNKNGVLPPLFHAHDEHHWLHAGRVDPVDHHQFEHLTKTKGFPKGISHDQFWKNLMHHHDEAHGRVRPRTEEEEKLDKHPLLRKMHKFISQRGQHPADLDLRNLGQWTHPHTGKKHIVVADYGFSHDVVKHYGDARENQHHHDQSKGYQPVHSGIDHPSVPLSNLPTRHRPNVPPPLPGKTQTSGGIFTRERKHKQDVSFAKKQMKLRFKGHHVPSATEDFNNKYHGLNSQERNERIAADMGRDAKSDYRREKEKMAGKKKYVTTKNGGLKLNNKSKSPGMNTILSKIRKIVRKQDHA